MIKEQKQICFINDCGALVDYSELANTVLWYAKSPEILSHLASLTTA